MQQACCWKQGIIIATFQTAEFIIKESLVKVLIVAPGKPTTLRRINGSNVIR